MCARIGPVLRVWRRIAEAELLGRDPGCELVGKELVGDAHFVAIRVATERSECGMLRLPAKAADASIPRRTVDHHRGATADAVAIAVVGIREGEQRLVRDRFDEPCAESGNRNASREDVRFDWHRWLTGV